MSAILPWAWLFPLPGLVLTAAGFLRPGRASLLGPPALLAAALLWLASGVSETQVLFPNWVPFLPDGALHFRADPLSAVMLAIVGFISTGVYVYSLEYMEHDPGQRRFFAFLDFFVFAMAVLVLAGNLALLLVGWAGVGLASFLLIAFWYQRPGTIGAGLQALAANAVGDAALLLAVVLVPLGCGDLLTLAEAHCTAGPGGAVLIAALIAIAAMAKSAQGPLYFWLPSAMAGPTPVSALIHAATMVAAGVYLLVRTHELLALAPGVMVAIAIVGVATALYGGLASLAQPNFKRGLAYSTVSQLGYMFAAVGVGASFAAFFHLFTHAFFKALLFLCAGAVIHALEGEEEMSAMGGLRKYLPGVHWLFLVGSLALIGVPAFSGAFSKDAIIEAALRNSPAVGVLLLAGTFLTGLYTGRLFFGAFYGPARGPAPDRHHLPGWRMLLPLVVLAVGSVVAGYFQFPGDRLGYLLAPVAGEFEPSTLLSPTGLFAGVLGLAGFAVAGLWIARGGSALAGAFLTRRTGWVEVVGSGGLALAQRVAAVQNGYLGLYLLGTLIGIAVIIILGSAASSP